MITLTKTCGFAGEERPLDQFDTMGLGWQSYCRSCSIKYKAKLAELRETNPKAGATEVREALGIPHPSIAKGTRGPLGHRPDQYHGPHEPHQDRTEAVPCLASLGAEALALLVGKPVHGLRTGLGAYKDIQSLPMDVQEEYRRAAAGIIGHRRTS